MQAICNYNYVRTMNCVILHSIQCLLKENFHQTCTYVSFLRLKIDTSELLKLYFLAEFAIGIEDLLHPF